MKQTGYLRYLSAVKTWVVEFDKVENEDGTTTINRLPVSKRVLNEYSNTEVEGFEVDFEIDGKEAIIYWQGNKEPVPKMSTYQQQPTATKAETYKVPKRVWINAPSTHDQYHKWHGKVGIAVQEKSGVVSVYFTEGDMHSMIVNPFYLEFKHG